MKNFEDIQYIWRSEW